MDTAADTMNDSNVANVHHSPLVWCLGHPVINKAPQSGDSAVNGEINDSHLITRVQAAYRSACLSAEDSSSFWDTSLRAF